MKVSIEQVEKLRERTNVSYEEARDALQTSDGDILEAIIALEKEGKTASSTAAFSTNNSLPIIESPQESNQNSNSNSNQSTSQNYNQNSTAGNGQNYYNNSGQNNQDYSQGNWQGNQNNNQGYGQNYNGNQYDHSQNTSFGEIMRKFFDFCGRVIHAGNVNQFKVHRFGRETLSLPVTALILLLIFFFPITVTVLIVALFFEYKYSFRGPNLGKEEINRAMNNASDVADDLKEQFKADASNPSNNSGSDGSDNADETMQDSENKDESNQDN